jgi:hypothetical protein
MRIEVGGGVALLREEAAVVVSAFGFRLTVRFRFFSGFVSEEITSEGISGGFGGSMGAVCSVEGEPRG